MKRTERPIIKPVPTVQEQMQRKGTTLRQCKTCFHAYQVALAPGSPAGLLCKESPPQFQMLPSGPGQLSVQEIPRAVVPDNFCHRWVIDVESPGI